MHVYMQVSACEAAVSHVRTAHEYARNCGCNVISDSSAYFGIGPVVRVPACAHVLYTSNLSLPLHLARFDVAARLRTFMRTCVPAR